jgi:RNA polymerase sigma-70 factor (ECF subfamily)
VSLLEPSDDDLIARFRRGDRAAFDALYQRHARCVFGYLVTLVHSDADARDILQESWLDVFRGLQPGGRYQEPNNFRGWLFRIAHNQCMNAFRRRKRLPRALEEQEEDGPLEQLPSGEPPPEFQALNAELRRLLLDCLNECLDEAHRSAFVLVVVEGLKYREAAEALGLAQGTVATRVSRSCARLRACLKKRGIEF